MTEQRNPKDESKRALLVTWGGLGSAIAIGITVVGGAIAILNWLYTENNRMRSELTEARIAIVSQQVTKAEFYQAIKETNERFERGLDRLEKRIIAENTKSRQAP
ncbi:MAG: hypothetical protein WAL02_15335 [Rhodoplanes sp.]